MNEGVERQRQAFQKLYEGQDAARWDFHDTPDRLTRYVRDRRIRLALKMLGQHVYTPRASMRALVVCGGVGGEGSLLANEGFGDVTVSDFSDAALAVCQVRDNRLAIRRLDAEAIAAPDESYDIVLVQDGLHHLTRPTLGLTEMLRVARRAVIVIEPHSGVVARAFGTTWEQQEGATNYVFRWNKHLLSEVTYSYLAGPDAVLCVKRLWDHSGLMARMTSRVKPDRLAVGVARASYGILDTLARPLGNMFVAVVVKAE